MDLENNSLIKLPDNIGKLSSLDALKVRGNLLTELPDSVGNLLSLRHLYVSENELAELPESIGNLESLYTLDAYKNKIKNLPESIGNLLSLERLNCTSNELTELPVSIGSLELLRELSFADNQITELPESLCKLSSLTNIFAVGNRLAKLPEDIGDLVSLKELHLGNNELVELPDSIENLSLNGDTYENPYGSGQYSTMEALGLTKNPLTFLQEPIRYMLSKRQLEEYKDLPTTRPPTASILSANPPLDAVTSALGQLFPTHDHEHHVEQPALKKADNEQSPQPPATLAQPIPALPASPTVLPLAVSPLQPISLTDDKRRRLDQILASDITLEHATFTQQERDKLDALILSMNDSIEAVVTLPATAQGATLPQAAIDKLMSLTEDEFTNGTTSEKKQRVAEIVALKTVRPNNPDAAKGGLLLYNLLYKALIGLHENAPQMSADVLNTNVKMASPGGAVLGKLAGLLIYMPFVGPQLASTAQAAVGSIEQRRVGRDVLEGLDRMASIGNADTPSQQKATIQRITHALVYRLALHHCAKTSSDAGGVMLAFKRAGGIDNRSINKFKTYAQKITDAIMKPATFHGADMDGAIERLLTAALTGTAASIQGCSPQAALKKARKLCEQHREIIAGLGSNSGLAGTATRGDVASASNVQSLLRGSGWMTAKLGVVGEAQQLDPALAGPSHRLATAVPTEMSLAQMMRELEMQKQVNRALWETNESHARKLAKLERHLPPQDDAVIVTGRGGADGNQAQMQEHRQSDPVAAAKIARLEEQLAIANDRLNQHALVGQVLLDDKSVRDARDDAEAAKKG